MASKRRKKRKQSESTQRIKPELMFVESPLQGSKYYSTPVQAARNPHLAASIPVDDLSHKWVSPQFPKNTETVETRTKRRTNNNKVDETRQPVIQKVPSLEFKDPQQSAKTAQTSIKNSIPVVDTRRSQRLKEQEQHFLFKSTIMGFTPERTAAAKVLVNETPENSVFPVVLRRLRDTRKHINPEYSQ